jgi:uncharacterized protein
MGAEVFWDTSGFFALLDRTDAAHGRVIDWIGSGAGRKPAVTTEWVVGETCTLLVARRRPHLVGAFLDRIERTAALTVINPDDALVSAAKLMIRRHAEHGYSFADCLSFCLMSERHIREALTADEHFRQAGFEPLLCP